MITLIQQGEVRMEHFVTVLKDVKELKSGDTLGICIQPMSRPDKRLMVFTRTQNPFYHVFENIDEIHETFQEDILTPSK